MRKNKNTSSIILIILVALSAAGALFAIYKYSGSVLLSDRFFGQNNDAAQLKFLPAQPANFPSLNTLAWGAYNGWQDSDIIDFEQKVGKKMPLVALFLHWGNENEFPSYLGPLIKKDDKTLVIFWEATDYNVASAEQPRFSYDAVLRGDWDSYFTTFAKNAKDFGWPVILIPFSEMNGNWFPCSITKNGNNAEKHILAYRYVHDFFKNIPNVRFGWAINVNNVPGSVENQIKLLYPGDQYVDYVGADGFNTGEPWQSYNEVFSRTNEALKVLKKPIYVFSIASAQGTKKAAWISDAFKQITSQPEIKGWIWFNENKEKDWRVWSDAASLEAFRAALP
ncbi:MAG: glycosyl hydrolase [bacterium]